MAEPTLTPRQIEALKAAFAAVLTSDGWLTRGSSRIWGMVPMTIKALVRKSLLERHRRHAKVRLTGEGRSGTVRRNAEAIAMIDIDGEGGVWLRLRCRGRRIRLPHPIDGILARWRCGRRSS